MREATVPALNLNNNAVTITAWIYPLGSQASASGLGFYRTGGTVARLDYYDASTLGYTWNDRQTTWAWSSGLTPPVNQWSFVALAVQPTQAILYLFTTNGLLTATNTLPHPMQAFAGSGTLGTDTYSASGRAFNGLMDEVAVFNSTLMAAQPQVLYANGFALSLVPLGFQKTGARLNLTWLQGTLLQASNLAGPWTRASASAAPFSVPQTNPVMFYRVLSH